ncbi:MAG: redoxin domain-containing protein [Deltaproteobacteria bacterium]|nr:redoxin domain-containing protein [Deltaproteobacteria bacterium]
MNPPSWLNLRWLLLPLAALLLAGGKAAVDARGWKLGAPAANTAAVFAPTETTPIVLPARFKAMITRPTYFFYYSPTCGHCQTAIPEVVQLQERLKERLDFVAVASSMSTAQQIAAFNDVYGVTFPTVHDHDGAFAQAIAARSTPTALVVAPAEEGGEVARVLGFYPWFPGASALLIFKLWPNDGFTLAFPKDVYQGGTSCAICHTEEARAWSVSHHAIAYRTLYTRDKADDPACVGCHVTGMGQPSGFTLGDHGSKLTNVTCEACHSAGGPHDGVTVDASATCVGCHDADHSIAFTVEKGLPHIDHYAALGLSDRELDDRWKLLTSGEAPKPLLAFPDGASQGAKACESCHPAEVKAWQASGHGEARSLLKGKEQRNPECLACHATPTRYTAGMPPETFLNEGVGCETCHGPGEQHVQAPSATNILGLGETCPECVIESVCTSCHTPQQDADWALQSHLTAIEGHR